MNDEGGLPGQARRLVLIGLLVGLAALIIRLVQGGGWDGRDVVGFVLIAAAGTVAHRFVLQLHLGDEDGNYDLGETVFVAGLMLLRPGPFLLAAAVGAAAGGLFRRIAPVKVIFNVGQFLVSLFVAGVIYDALVPFGDVGHRAWLAALVAMTAFFVINETAVDLVISLVEGIPFKEVLAKSVGLGIAHFAVNVALGLLTVLLWSTDRWAVLLLTTPLVLAHLAYRNWLRARREREQMEVMAQAADAISLESEISRRMPGTDETPALASLASTLNRMLERLEAGFHRERRFIRDASHELRTPVTITRGYLELLGHEPEPQEVQEAVGVAMEELDRMGRLITDLTTLAKADDPGFVQPGSIDLDGFLDRIAAKVRSVLDGRLRYESAPPDAVVSGDEQRLTQALLNLLQNAVVHTVGDSPIELRAIEREESWRFEVVDQGGGLPPGEEDLVFEPFHRLNGDRPGSGLGLAIVKGIAEGHGGRAGVDNRPGKGATFWIEVPR